MKELLISFVLVLITIITNLNSNAQIPTYEWAVTFGSTLYDNAGRVKVDKEGNVYTSGSFHGNVDFDPGPGSTIMSDTNGGFFLLKIDKNSVFQWVLQLEIPPTDMEVDDSMNVLVSGYFNGTKDLDPGSGTFFYTSPYYSVGLIKINELGGFVWAKVLDGNNSDIDVQNIEIDKMNNIYLCGQFTDTVDFDLGTGVANHHGQKSIYAVKYNWNGNLNWIYYSGAANFSRPIGMEIDDSNNVLITGTFKGLLDFNPQGGGLNLTTFLAANEIFMLKLDSQGSLNWVKQFTGPGSSFGRDIAIDNEQNIFLLGVFNSDSIDFNPGPGTDFHSTEGYNDISISKFSPSGQYIWTKTIGGVDYESASDILIDLENNIYITGDFRDSVDFDPGAGMFNMINSAVAWDPYIVSLDSAGSFNWAHRISGSGGSGSHFALANSALYTVGRFRSIGDFDPGPGVAPHSSNGNYDAYILKLDLCYSVTNLDSSSCGPILSPDGLQVWSSSGTYQYMLVNSLSCDSIININLVITNIDNSVTLTNSITLESNSSSGSFQWLDCDNNFAPISGANNQIFIASDNGNYAVQITNNGCMDTSACMTIDNVGLFENAFESYFTINPNPTDGFVTVSSDRFPLDNLRVVSLSGQDVTDQVNPIQLSPNAWKLDCGSLERGVYFVDFGLYSAKLVKE